MKRHLVIISILACLCATVLAVSKGFASRAAIENWLLSKKVAVTSCNRGNSESKDNMPKKNGENGCSHMGASCTLFINGSRRNKIHSC